MLNVPLSSVIGLDTCNGAAASLLTETVVIATAPVPAAFRKFLREYFILISPSGPP
jgi:hypothetical protein